MPIRKKGDSIGMSDDSNNNIMIIRKYLLCGRLSLLLLLLLRTRRLGVLSYLCCLLAVPFSHTLVVVCYE